MGEPLHIISLGAGVQSSTMALMAAAGEITPLPHCAVFADTKDEPPSVYNWLGWLEKNLPFPIHRVGKEKSLSATCLEIRNKRDGSGRWAKTAVPAFIANPDGTRGIIQRQCTYDHKVMPLIRETLRLLYVLRYEEKNPTATQWIGISLDEVHRMKPSKDKRIEHRWPLVDLKMSRHDCLRWMEAKGFPKPPRSACVYCPYHSDHEWRRLRAEEPEAFLQAVKFDHDYRQVKRETKNIAGLPYLHSSLIPLDQVDFSTDIDRGQTEIGFGNECEGMCGV